MSICILRGERAAALYCSTSGWAFGPVFYGDSAAEDAEAFVGWCERKRGTLRLLSDAELERFYYDWRRHIAATPKWRSVERPSLEITTDDVSLCEECDGRHPDGCLMCGGYGLVHGYTDGGRGLPVTVGDGLTLERLAAARDPDDAWLDAMDTRSETRRDGEDG